MYRNLSIDAKVPGTSNDTPMDTDSEQAAGRIIVGWVGLGLAG